METYKNTQPKKDKWKKEISAENKEGKKGKEKEETPRSKKKIALYLINHEQ